MLPVHRVVHTCTYTCVLATYAGYSCSKVTNLNVNHALDVRPFLDYVSVEILSATPINIFLRTSVDLKNGEFVTLVNGSDFFFL